MEITKLEKRMLEGIVNSEFNDTDELAEVSVWTHSAIDASKLDAKQARGVIASLVKKGLVDNYIASNPDDCIISYTELGVQVYKQL